MFVIFLISMLISTMDTIQEECYSRRTKNNIAGNMMQYQLWRKNRVPRVSTCGVNCCKDKLCSAYQYSTVLNTCVGFYHGIQPSSWRNNSFLHYKVSKYSRNCDRTMGFTYDGSLDRPMCFKVVRKKKSWSRAKSACQKYKGHLIVLDSDKKVEKFKGIKFSSEFKLYWVGMQRIYSGRTEFRFMWFNNSTYIKAWNNQEPDIRVRQNCVQLSANGFDDMYCSERRAYICELSI